MKIKNQQKKIVEALKSFAELKGITKEEIKKLLEESFQKALNKEYENDLENKEVMLPLFDISINLDEGKISIKRKWILTDKIISEEEINIKKNINDLNLENLNVLENLKIDDYYFEDIDLNAIEHDGFFLYVKQLFTQKVSEAEKVKIYEKFIDYKDQIVKAKVEKVALTHYLLSYQDNVIFLSKRETSKLDQFKFGDFVYVYITKIEKSSRDAQIIASRKNKEFIVKLLEKEIEDVADNVIRVEKIARQPGFKTKIIVSSSLEEVDPVGSIIGVKGQKIRPIIDELRGERIDIIEYSKDIDIQIARAVIPGKIIGTKKVSDEKYILVTEEKDFLSVLGKSGLNIKLVANLVDKKLDVKTKKMADEEKVSYHRIVIPTAYQNRSNRKNFSKIVDENYDENYDLLEDLASIEEYDDYDQELDKRY
ncbi:Transcription elongation protein nusA [Candidatus Hepatoplasma crinochetorum Av]|uniref:Transcription elongation protein nusA n=1 Tax=Candidatus Hepatoplasma crinochetorum Av TaxID=1427984 RepID=W8GFA4_9MOLU|nr:NusA N-terminal domain-containing protein [Candidatus Hepatoplasma crinochetorum]AHK22288.1 Transcription elongation protein nusA [Candidatus Hepatoplasma crinochetorum Av]